MRRLGCNTHVRGVILLVVGLIMLEKGPVNEQECE